MLTLALLLLSLPACSPLQEGGKCYARYTKPLPSVRLDLETGVVTRGPVVTARSAGTVAEFSNLDLSGFIAVDTGSCFCRWLDEGIKGGQGNSSDLMSSIVFAYCSSALDTNSGGPGGTAALGFYEGYSTGGGTPSTTVAAFTLTGMPANTGDSSFFGGFRCFFMMVEFSPLVCFADGQIGYSWKFLDGTGAGTLAQTWTFLACIQSCSGLQDQSPPFMDLYIDQYCPPGFLRSTFNFGTRGGPGGKYISIAMEIREVSDCAATLATNAGQGLDLDALSAPVALVGSPWVAGLIVNDPSHPPAGVSTLLFGPTGLATGPRLSLFGGPVTELLLAPASLSMPCGVESYAGLTTTLCSGTVIPKDAALVGAPWNVQALTGTPAAGMTLSNALGGTVGTF